MMLLTLSTSLLIVDIIPESLDMDPGHGEQYLLLQSEGQPLKRMKLCVEKDASMKRIARNYFICLYLTGLFNRPFI